MPTTDSILRYPGGKTKLTAFVSHLFKINNMQHIIYCEPFCGGAGVALKLLLTGIVDRIVLNDYDIAIYSIWYAVLNDTEKFIEQVKEAVLNVEEWHHQKTIYDSLKNIKTYNFDLAFAAFYLNRTNRSGIIAGGLIGGEKQQGRYGIGCRFNKKALENKIRRIANKKKKIELFNRDGIEFVHEILPRYPQDKLFVFFDPPYVKKGAVLYQNKLPAGYHQKLAGSVQALADINWIVTYDHEKDILNMYQNAQQFQYLIQYTAAIKKKDYEYMFASLGLQVESFDKVNFEAIIDNEKVDALKYERG